MVECASGEVSTLLKDPELGFGELTKTKRRYSDLKQPSLRIPEFPVGAAERLTVPAAGVVVVTRRSCCCRRGWWRSQQHRRRL